MRNDLYLKSDIWNFLPEDTAAHIAQTHLFFDIGATYDQARRVTEPAAGVGIGFSYYTDRVTFSGVVAAPLVENTKVRLGSPVVQLRMDLKTW